ncbi:MAG: arylsulfotransferase family protein [Magnetospiraceae bacterium]
MKDRIAFLAFLGSALLLAFLYGFFSGKYALFPHDTVTEIVTNAQILKEHWKNDFGVEPTRHLTEVPSDRQRLTIDPEGPLAPGNRIILGVVKDRETLFGALLLDATGKERHFWPLPYEEVDPDGLAPQNVFPHGMAVLPSGSLILTFDGSSVMARISACGDVEWVQGGGHHVMFRSYDGTVWTLSTTIGKWHDFLLQLDPETGDILKKIDFQKDVLMAGRHNALLALNAEQSPDHLVQSSDPFHTNDLEVLSPALADAFPMFDAGDILLSFRHMNMLAVIDGGDYHLKWWKIGPWHRQHDPDFLPDGTIMVYDNNMSFGESRILTIDPGTEVVSVAYEGTEEAPFYAYHRGKQQSLKNGNILITDPVVGRGIEVTSEGRIVWEYQNIFDQTRNGKLGNIQLVPVDFFEEGALDCP